MSAETIEIRAKSQFPTKRNPYYIQKFLILNKREKKIIIGHPDFELSKTFTSKRAIEEKLLRISSSAENRLKLPPTQISKESIKIANLFFDEKSSINVLLILYDGDGKTLDDMKNIIHEKKKMYKILYSLFGLNLIKVSNDKIVLTNRGIRIIENLKGIHPGR